MEEQGAFVGVAVVVEVVTARLSETFQRALALVRLLYDVRRVRAAQPSARVGRLAKLGCHRGDSNRHDQSFVKNTQFQTRHSQTSDSAPVSQRSEVRYISRR